MTTRIRWIAIAATFTVAVTAAAWILAVDDDRSDSKPALFTIDLVKQGLARGGIRAELREVATPDDPRVKGALIGEAKRADGSELNTIDFAVVVWRDRALGRDSGHSAPNPPVDQWRPFVPFAMPEYEARTVWRNIEYQSNVDGAFGNPRIVADYERAISTRREFNGDITAAIVKEVGIENLLTED